MPILKSGTNFRLIDQLEILPFMAISLLMAIFFIFFLEIVILHHIVAR